MTIEFQGWPKTPRLNRDMIVTEKIDGTNAGIIIERDENPGIDLLETAGFARIYTPEDDFAVPYLVGAQSRKRLIKPWDDNFGFAHWVCTHAAVLVEQLGVGRHFGEWWGLGIQRGYGQTAKRFSLFNVHRYSGIYVDFDDETSLGTVPILYQGPFSTPRIDFEVERLRAEGSTAVPGYDKPEGVVVYHTAGGHTYKALLEGDDTHKEAHRG